MERIFEIAGRNTTLHFEKRLDQEVVVKDRERSVRSVVHEAPASEALIHGVDVLSAVAVPCHELNARRCPHGDHACWRCCLYRLKKHRKIVGAPRINTIDWSYVWLWRLPVLHPPIRGVPEGAVYNNCIGRLSKGRHNSRDAFRYENVAAHLRTRLVENTIACFVIWWPTCARMKAIGQSELTEFAVGEILIAEYLIAWASLKTHDRCIRRLAKVIQGKDVERATKQENNALAKLGRYLLRIHRARLGIGPAMGVRERILGGQQRKRTLSLVDGKFRTSCVPYICCVL